MFKNKKGDMTLNIIIAAAIAMVVLVVMILIFTGNIGKVNTSCTANGGEVLDPGMCGYNYDTYQYVFNPACVMAGNFNDVTTGKVCCNVGLTDANGMPLCSQ